MKKNYKYSIPVAGANTEKLSNILALCKQTPNTFYPPYAILPEDLYLRLRQEIAQALGVHVVPDVSDPMITLDDCEGIIRHVFWSLGFSDKHAFHITQAQCEAVGQIIISVMDSKSTEHRRHLEFVGVSQWATGWR